MILKIRIQTEEINKKNKKLVRDKEINLNLPSTVIDVRMSTRLTLFLNGHSCICIKIFDQKIQKLYYKTSRKAPLSSYDLSQ